jgi:hypothetical protein
MALRLILICVALFGISGSSGDLSCDFLEGVIKTPGSDTVGLNPLHPGQFATKNSNSPDATVRVVMDYSSDPAFTNLANVDVSSDIFQSDYRIPLAGIDVDDEFRINGEGDVMAGRFVYVEGAVDQEFYFPQTRKLGSGRVYYFRNYRVRGDCVAPPVESHVTFPSEVATTPVSEKSKGLPSVPLGLVVTDVSRDRLAVTWLAPLDSGDASPLGMAVSYVVTVTAVVDASTGVLMQAYSETVIQTDTSAVFTLVQGQLYRIDVSSRNDFGAVNPEP